MYISVNNLCQTFKRKNGKGGYDDFQALKDVNFTINKGEFICLLGFSGCGKSTILNLLAGFEHPTEGEIFINGKQVDKPSPRYITIFQNYGLLPWKNVRKNIELGLTSSGLERNDIDKTVDKYLGLVGLGNYANSYPSQLSGGQQQRVAIARGLAVNPEILFMDEPFGALDPIIRNKLQDDLLKIVKKENKTVVFVTHDIEEAVYLADRIFVMKDNPGHIEKVINVALEKPRSRNTPLFGYYREMIYNQLFSIFDTNIDYII